MANNIVKKIKSLKDGLNKIGVSELFRTEVKSFGTSGHIIIPKKYVGKKVLILILKR